MTALAIDTATEACSAALMHEGRLYHRHEMAPRRHAQLMLPMIDGLLEEAGCGRDELEWIAFGQGPGAFTGVRIAAGIAHGLSLGLDCGLVPVSTLAALAFDAHERHGDGEDEGRSILACLDARMGEVYWAAFVMEGGLPKTRVEELVCLPEQVSAANLDISRSLAIGPGWATYPERLADALGGRPALVEPDRFPDAAPMLRLATAEVAAGRRLLSPVEAQPIYLRDNVAKPSQPKS